MDNAGNFTEEVGEEPRKRRLRFRSFFESPQAEVCLFTIFLTAPHNPRIVFKNCA